MSMFYKNLENRQSVNNVERIRREKERGVNDK